MFIVIGRYSGFELLGRVVDFCPFCLRFCPFKLYQNVRGYTVYVVPVGKGSDGQFIACEQCGCFWPTDSSRYKGPSSSDQIDQITTESFPGISEYYKERLEWEKLANEGRLDGFQRRRMMQEPFRHLEYMVQTHKKAVKMDWKSGLGCLSAIVVPFWLLLYGTSLNYQKQQLFVSAAFLSTFVLGGSSIYEVVTKPTRLIRYTYQPTIVRVLRRLRPSTAELEEALRELRAEYLFTGKIFQARQICDAIEEST
jgi:hypothetical protein